MRKESKSQPFTCNKLLPVSSNFTLVLQARGEGLCCTIDGNYENMYVKQIHVD